ncbi:MAG: DUF4301 family protein [Alphaproteobacteria bacterium]|nr:DUF4301 family protein [Alphaproteobacteria bacterium]
MFSDTDIQNITKHGLTVESVLQQIDNFKTGFPYANIVRPATVDDGILKLSDIECEKYINIYDSNRDTKTITKFVPASGAATRMFKDLFEYLATQQPNQTSITVLSNLDKFAFYDDLKINENAIDSEIIDNIINGNGLNYGKTPKALIKFHNYDDGARTAAAEHLIEGAQYASSNNNVNIHFTLSPEHLDTFNNLMQSIIPEYEKRFNVKYNITTSVQKPSTDTIAVTPNNELFRQSNGELLFRPAGHGALIENLNEINSDIIFIKNIDNICNDAHRADTIKYKQVLAGLLIETQNHIFKYIDDLRNNTYNKQEICDFIQNTLKHKLPQDISITELIGILNRPIRVCGVVQNIGAPGGGPFWVKGTDNTESLQIVESAQIAPNARDIMNTSTHFNPVDLVCGIRDSQGNVFDLQEFIDHTAGFISDKSASGKSLRAMEKPGLWNGAMAYWHTIFVEVPATTFTPVKTVADLLLPPHTNN